MTEPRWWEDVSEEPEPSDEMVASIIRKLNQRRYVRVYDPTSVCSGWRAHQRSMDKVREIIAARKTEW